MSAVNGHTLTLPRNTSQKELKVIISDICNLATMKPLASTGKSKKNQNNGLEWEDEHIKYKLNKSFTKKSLSPKKNPTSEVATHTLDDTDCVRYKFPADKPKAKRNNSAVKKIKIKFWGSRIKSKNANINQTSKPYSVLDNLKNSKPTVAKASPKLRQKVSTLPPPLFTDQHVPMVTVPDDLTVHFNEEEANDLLITADSFRTADTTATRASFTKTPTGRVSTKASQNSPRSGQKRKRDSFEDPRSSDTELEFFAKYVVQKLRKMETNQRIYSENLINTVLMLGQLQKLNGKYKINET